MLKRLFNTLKLKKSHTTTDKKNHEWHQVLSAEELLDTPLRQQYLQTIWQNVSMTPKMYKTLYETPIKKYAELVQILPASESHHHSHLGGMLDHGLEVISIAAKLRQNYVLPQNSPPEEQAKQRDIWTAVIIYAALLHDIGKILVDIELLLKDSTIWHPWQGKPSQPFKFRYIKDRDYQLHPNLGGFLAPYFIPQEALNWIMDYPKAFSTFMYFISGHTDKAGILNEIIQKADQFSVTMSLGGDINKLSETPKISFAKQLHIALTHVVKNLKINAPKGGGAGWLTQDGLWVMSKTIADSIRAYLMSQGISVPSQNGKLFDELQAHKLIETTPENNAIWNCNIISNAGWKPETIFTLLKISPNIIWDKIDDRPSFFDGQVLSTNSPAEALNTIEQEIMLATENNSVTEELPKQSDDTLHDTKEIDPLENILNLFPVTAPITEEPSTPETLSEPELITETEPVLNTRQIDSKSIINKSTDIKLTSHDNNHDIALNFIQWVKKSITSGDLIYNKPNAKLHIVENCLFLVTPSIFQYYIQTQTGNTNKEEWELLQKRFQTLGLHKRQKMANGDSQNIWSCLIVGQKKKSILNGYLIDNLDEFFGKNRPINNHWLQIQGDLT